MTSTRTNQVQLTVPAGGVAAGDTLILATGQKGTTVSSIVDSRGNSYTIHRQIANGSWANVTLASATITTALQASDTITVTFAATATTVRIVTAYDFTGVSTSSRLDQNSAGTTGLTAPGSHTLTATTSGTTQQSAELAFAAWSVGSLYPFTAGPGYTAGSAGSGSSYQIDSEWGVLRGDPGVATATATTGGSYIPWAGTMSARGRAAAQLPRDRRRRSTQPASDLAYPDTLSAEDRDLFPLSKREITPRQRGQRDWLWRHPATIAEPSAANRLRHTRLGGRLLARRSSSYGLPEFRPPPRRRAHRSVNHAAVIDGQPLQPPGSSHLDLAATRDEFDA